MNLYNRDDFFWDTIKNNKTYLKKNYNIVLTK